MGIQFGIKDLDHLIGKEGIPENAITEIYGESTSGLSTLALQACAAAVKAGKTAIFFDGTQMADLYRIEELGATGTNVFDVQELESAVAAIKQLIGHVDLIVVNAVNCMMPKAWMACDLGNADPCSYDKILSVAMPEIRKRLEGSNTSLIIVNHKRHTSIRPLKQAMDTGDYGYQPRQEYFLFWSVTRLGMFKYGEDHAQIVVAKNNRAPTQAKTCVLKRTLSGFTASKKKPYQAKESSDVTGV